MKRAAAGDSSLSKKYKGQSPEEFYRNTLRVLETLHADDADRLAATAFLKLPLKKLYPDYYTLISEPISLSEIHKKALRGIYEGPQQLVADFRLMYKNAMKYNDPESWIVLDANKLLEFVEQQVTEFGQGLEPIGVADLPKLCGELLDEVIHHEFPGEGVLSGPFMDDVDVEEYPDYGKVIAHPTSFNNVRGQLSSLFSSSASLDNNLHAFYEAANAIFVNAQTYNDPSALIYEDARKLQEVFEEKYNALRHEAVPDARVRLTLKAPKEPVKLKLSLKREEPKKKRGRKPKRHDEDPRLAVKQEELDAEDENSRHKLEATEWTIMGKHKHAPSTEEVFIRDVSFTSAANNALQLMTTLGSQPLFAPTKSQAWKQAFFPDVKVLNTATFFEYGFQPTGFSTQAHSISLPQDSTPFITLKVALHELIHDLKKQELIGGQGLFKSSANDEFLVALLVNEEEAPGGFEMSEEKDSLRSTKTLCLLHDLKLNYGLNVLTFELRLAPNLAKELKTELPEPEVGDQGRHTRHQLQQIRLNWDVERFTLYVVSHCP